MLLGKPNLKGARHFHYDLCLFFVTFLLDSKDQIHCKPIHLSHITAPSTIFSILTYNPTMAYKTLYLALIASLTTLISTSPIDITPNIASQMLSKRTLTLQCPGAQVPDSNSPINACLLPSFSCPSVNAQKAQLAPFTSDSKCMFDLLRFTDYFAKRVLTGWCDSPGYRYAGEVRHLNRDFSSLIRLDSYFIQCRSKLQVRKARNPHR